MGTVKELDVGVFANSPMSSILTRPEYIMSVRLMSVQFSNQLADLTVLQRGLGRLYWNEGPGIFYAVQLAESQRHS